MKLTARTLTGFTTAAAMTLSLGIAGTADATLIAYEGFDYTAGEQLSGKSGGTGWVAESTWSVGNSARAVIQDGGLSYMNLQVSGNAIYNPTTSTTTASRAFANAPESGSVFFSFLVAGGETTFGRLGALLRPSDGSNSPGVIGLSAAQSFDGGSFGLRPNQANIGGLNNTNPGGAAVVGTNLVVAQYNYETNQASYWVNPTSLGGTAPAATISGIGFTDPTQLINQFLFGYSDSNATTAIFDEFRVGTTYASVTPIPEPGSLALLGLGGLLMLGRGRRADA